MSPVSPIKSIYIEDFQSHSKTNISLGGPGELTVIVGPTDSGKTAIVRGLRLLMYNVPQGTDYIRVGRNMAAVAVELADGTKVVRERSKSVNRYRIVKQGATPQVFEGFGNSVPLEVQEATGVRTVSIGDTIDLALNLSQQLDGPFLGKSVSGPAKAKILGALAGTEEVDEAQRTLGTDLHRAGQEEKRLAAEIENLDARIGEYDYLPALAERIEALKTLLEAVRSAQSRLQGLKTAKTKLDSINAQRMQALTIIARWANLSGAIIHAESAETALIRLQALKGHLTTLRRISDEWSRWFKVAHIRWAGLEAAIWTYEELEKSWTRKKILADLLETLSVTLAGIERCKITLSRWQGLSEAEALHTQTSERVTKLQVLKRLHTRLNEVLDAQLEAGRAYGKWYRLDDVVHIVAQISAVNDRLCALTQVSHALSRIRQSRVMAEDALAKHSKALADAQSLYADTLIQLGRCPTCGSQVSPDTIKSHIEEVA